MPAKKQAKVLVTCPRCGHQQSEPRAAISTACKQCGQYIRVQEVLKPAARAQERPPEMRKITCFECGTELDVAVSLHADGLVVLRATGRLFGDVEAKNLVVEEGAVMVGRAKIGV